MGKQYGGEIDGYEEFDTERDAWAINNGYEKHLDAKDPKKTPRVETQGQPGYETEAAYNRRIAADEKKGKEIWAAAIPGFSGDARKTAMTAEKYDARAMFEAVKVGHGDKTNKQMASFTKDFNSRKLRLNEDINKFNAEWKNGARKLEHSGMGLPKQYLVNLYLAALGNRYRMVETAAQVLPESERTLDRVMRMALDHASSLGDTGEADNRDTALYAGRPPWKRTWHRAFAATEPCSVCGDPRHSKETCFKPGGGLAHLNATERREWLEARWKQRRIQYGNQSWQRPAEKKTETEKAMAAMQKDINEMKAGHAAYKTAIQEACKEADVSFPELGINC